MEKHAYQAEYRAAHRVEKLAYNHAYYAVHRDDILAQKRVYGQAHKAEHGAYMRDYYQSHREECIARAVAYAQAHLAQRAASGRVYYERHREQALERGRRRRATKAAVRIGRVHYQTIMERDRMVCGICHKKAKLEDLSFDHIVPLSKGGPHTDDNIQVAHRLCNARRGASGKMPVQTRFSLGGL